VVALLLVPAAPRFAIALGRSRRLSGPVTDITEPTRTTLLRHCRWRWDEWRRWVDRALAGVREKAPKRGNAGEG